MPNIHEFEATARKHEEELKSITAEFQNKQKELKINEDAIPTLTREINELTKQLEEKKTKLMNAKREALKLKDEVRKEQRDMETVHAKLQMLIRQQETTLHASGVDVKKT